MSQEILDFFMEEVGELFDSINSLLLGHEEIGTMDDENIDSLFRDMHTIKGGAGSVGLLKLSGYTHYLETFLDSIRNKEQALNQDIISFLIDSVGTMQDIMDEESADNLDEDLYKQRLTSLLKALENFKQGKSTTIKNESDQQSRDIMTDLFGDLNTLIDNVLEENSYQSIPMEEIFRIVHTLKGSSQFLNVENFPTFIHELETLLDGTRNGKYAMDSKLFTVVQDTLQNAQTIFNDEMDGTLEKAHFDEELASLQETIKNIDANNTQQAFELFEEQSVEELQAFELFDDDEADYIEEKLQSFELFDDDSTDEKIATKEIAPVATVKPVQGENREKIEEIQTKTSDTQKPTDEETKKETPIKKAAPAASIRVNLDKIDQLMNRVGDLVITKSMLFQFANSSDKDNDLNKDLLEKLGNLDRDIRELQDSVMSVRMIPMESVYSRLPKMVRDLSRKLSKRVQFEHHGDSVEIDKMMVEGLMDPLTHIIRNSLDHGIEEMEERKAKGKPEKGLLRISASQESGNIIISIYDDGAGINVEKVTKKALQNGIINDEQLSKMTHNDKLMLIFSAGLSTAEKLSDVSGRGVGMDVVMTNITSLGGHIQVSSVQDKGSEFKIILPLTLAILDGLNVLIGEHKLILPLNNIVESLQPTEKSIKRVGENNRELLMLRHEFIPIIRLNEFFGIKSSYDKLEDGMLIVVRSSNTKVALFVDEFLNQEQIVVKSLEKNYKKVQGIGAATIRGDGSIGLILDILSILDIANKERMLV